MKPYCNNHITVDVTLSRLISIFHPLYTTESSFVIVLLGDDGVAERDRYKELSHRFALFLNQ